MRGYYVVNDEDQLVESESAVLPEGLDEGDAINLIHGWMFEDNWCPGTDHAIYIDDGSGYEPVYEEGVIADVPDAQLMPRLRLVQNKEGVDDGSCKGN